MDEVKPAGDEKPIDVKPVPGGTLATAITIAFLLGAGGMKSADETFLRDANPDAAQYIDAAKTEATVTGTATDKIVAAHKDTVRVFDDSGKVTSTKPVDIPEQLVRPEVVLRIDSGFVKEGGSKLIVAAWIDDRLVLDHVSQMVQPTPADKITRARITITTFDQVK